jgi:CheY-like chemotaxis protein
MRILLVEDNPADVGLVREALEEHVVDCDLTVITDGESAIRFIQELDRSDAELPTLVILDLNLPRRTGRDVLQSLRASVRLSKAPTVILSSSDGKTDREDAARLGASAYIRKPSQLGDFIALGAIFKSFLSTQAPS